MRTVLGHIYVTLLYMCPHTAIYLRSTCARFLCPPLLRLPLDALRVAVEGQHVLRHLHPRCITSTHCAAP
jgi:hypothetical protein